MKHREEMVGGASLSCFNPEKKVAVFGIAAERQRLKLQARYQYKGCPLSIFPQVDLSTVDALDVGMKLAYKLWLKRWAVFLPRFCAK